MSNIIRRQRVTWTSVDNRIINDTRLGLKPLGLLIYMLSKPNDWQFNQEQLGRTWDEGREAMRSMMRTLQACGYVRREYAHDEHGRIRTVTIVSELPEQPDLFCATDDGATEGRVSRQSGEPPVVDPTVGQPVSIVKTDLNKELRGVKKRASAPSVSCPAGVSENVWSDFLTLRKQKRAPLTATALEGIQQEAGKAGITLEDALRTCCKRGWQGFEAEWLAREQQQPRQQPGMVDTQARNAAAKRMLGFGERE